jgi:tetrathionate reductase subunit B
MQYGMIIDLKRCVGCHACTIACRAEWEVPVPYQRDWVKRLGPTMTDYGMAATYYPGLCNHCDVTPCVSVCPVDAVERIFTDAKSGKTTTLKVTATWKDPFDGTVQVDKERCVGCGACADACPYGARFVNPAQADENSVGKVDKCTYCKPRVDQGLVPSCVLACITDARIFGDLDDPNSAVSQYVKNGAKGLEVKDGHLGPNTLYFGTKKDMALLFAEYTPKLADMDSVKRRAMMASMVKPAMRKVQEIGVLGLAGAMLVKGLSENDEK